MRQNGRTSQHNPDPDLTKELLLHSILEEDDARNMVMASYHPSGPHPGHPSIPAARGPLTPSGDPPEPQHSHHPSAASDSSSWQGGPAPLGGREDSNRSVNPVDIGIKVANEIIGLHSQAAATGRALAQSTRQAEFYHEENARLKDELDRVHQARQGSDEEVARLKGKLSQRSIELLLLEQKVQAAEERAEAQAHKAAEQADATATATERYDALVNRLMVVVVKASVAAEQLEKALLAANKTPGMRCNCKPALHHGLDALASLADFRDTWLAGSALGSNRTFSSSTAAQAAAAQAALLSPRTQGSMHRTSMGKESLLLQNENSRAALRSSNSGSDSLRSPANGSGSPLGRHTNGRQSSAGGLSRQPMLRSVTTSDLHRQSGLRPGGSGDICSQQPRSSGEVPRLHIAMLQQQMQQAQRQARESSFDSPGRMTARSGIGTCSSSPRRGPGISKTEALEAAADLVYGSMLQQHQRQLPSTSGRFPAAAAAAAATTAARQPPPWNSGCGAQRRYSQANPSSPARSAASPRRSVYFAEDVRSPPSTSSGADRDGYRMYGGDSHYDAHDDMHYDEPSGHPRDDYEEYDDYQGLRGGPDRSCHPDNGWY